MLLNVCYEEIQKGISSSGDGQGGVIVLLEDLAHLEWTGFEEEAIIRFLRSIRSLLRKVRALISTLRLGVETNPAIRRMGL